MTQQLMEDPEAIFTEDEANAVIAQDILDAIERGPDGRWRFPWHCITGGRPTNAFTGRAYRGNNVLTLWTAARKKGFVAHQWGSEGAWKGKRATVRPGEVGTIVLVPIVDDETPGKPWTRRTPGIRKVVGPLGRDAEGGELRRVIGYRKEPFFNVAQVDGVEIRPPAVPTPDEAAERLLEALNRWRKDGGPAVVHGGLYAHWRPDVDRVTMPDAAAFHDYEGLSGRAFYAATLGHEFIHASGSKGRLARSTLEKYHTSKQIRAKEELIAEMGAAFLCGHFGLPSVLRPDHAKYCRSWLDAIKHKEQRSTFFWAVRQAELASDFVLKQIQAAR